MLFYNKVSFSLYNNQILFQTKMKSTCRRKFLNQIIKIKEKQENQTCTQAILIVDEKTTQILKEVTSVQNLLDLGIKNFTKINLNKKPQLHAIGIYFISQESIKLIEKDFQKKPIYFSINILACESISQQTMNFVANSQKIMQRLATFTQFHFPITYLNQRIAIFPNSENYLKSIFKQQGNISQEIGQRIFQTIASGFNNLSQVQLYHSEDSKFGNPVANQILKSFKDYQTNLSEEENQLVNLSNKKNIQESDDITIILFDRNIDYVSPMVRNYYYFPMMADLFNIRIFEPLTITNLNKEHEEIKIQFDDKIFLKYKNKHVSDAITEISKDLEKFMTQNKAAKFQKEKDSIQDNKNLKQIIKELPQYSKTVKNYNLHIQILKEISNKSKRENLSQLGQLQHLIITSLTSKAEVQKDKKILKKAMELMSTMQDLDTKARIIFLILQCLEINQKQKQDLLAFYERTPGYEGFSLIFEKSLTGKLRYNPQIKKQSIFLDRHQCIVAKRSLEILMGKPSKQFKRLEIEISGQGKYSKFKKLKNKSKKKVLIVMLGGLSVNQISNLQRISQQNQIQFFFLTDHITNPKTYLSDLKHIFESKK